MNDSPAKRRRLRFSLRTLLIAVGLVALSLGLWANWDYIPGTVRLDDRGFPRGTGTLQWFYKSGALQIEERYLNGVIQTSTWYLPDGSVFASEDFDTEHGGVGYYLYEDGSIRAKYQYKFDPASRLYIADGDAVFYRPDGSIDRTAEFRDGEELKPE